MKMIVAFLFSVSIANKVEMRKIFYYFQVQINTNTTENRHMESQKSFINYQFMKAASVSRNLSTYNLISQTDHFKSG